MYSTRSKEHRNWRQQKQNWFIGFSGFEIPMQGVAKMISKYKDKQISCDFFVVEAKGQPLCSE